MSQIGAKLVLLKSIAHPSLRCIFNPNNWCQVSRSVKANVFVDKGLKNKLDKFSEAVIDYSLQVCAREKRPLPTPLATANHA